MWDRLKKNWTDTRQAVKEAAAADKLRNIQTTNNANNTMLTLMATPAGNGRVRWHVHPHRLERPLEGECE